jgi:hypothetical protein
LPLIFLIFGSELNRVQKLSRGEQSGIENGPARASPQDDHQSDRPTSRAFIRGAHLLPIIG